MAQDDEESSTDEASCVVLWTVSLLLFHVGCVCVCVLKNELFEISQFNS